MFSLAFYDGFLAAAAFVFGAVVGSFLNVCIYRMPLGLSVNEPKRSFCPNCKQQIAWHHNLPIVSWLALRGKCAYCGKPISIRYPLVELLTAGLFLCVWLECQDAWILVIPYWLFVALILVATFIDFDHFIIPDEITIGATVAGVLLSGAIPMMMGEQSRVSAVGWSLAGAATGYAILRLVVEGGKLAFGKKRVVLPEPLAFEWRRKGEEDAELKIGDDVDLWSDFFSREKDELILECDELQFGGRECGKSVLRCYHDRLELAGVTYELTKLEPFSGRLREFVFPREAMGLGDVKFMAGIGAFLGWRAVLFTIAAGSLAGSLIGLGLLLFGPKARSLRVPFGPYLSVGALLWLFAGPRLVNWYLGLIHY